MFKRISTGVLAVVLAGLAGCAPIYRGLPIGSVSSSSVSSAPPAPAPSTDWGALDVFPLPAPKASAQVDVPADLLAKNAVRPATLGAAAVRLSMALDATGYFERSFRPTPGGFALITRIERMNQDGTPAKQARFDVTMTEADQRPFDMQGYLRALFTANPGHYRVIVFLVTDQIVTQSNVAAKSDVLKDWMGSGAVTLPKNVGLAPYTDAHNCIALVYEFTRSNAADGVQQAKPSALLGREHLQKAGLWSALSK